MANRSEQQSVKSKDGIKEKFKNFFHLSKDELGNDSTTDAGRQRSLRTDHQHSHPASISSVHINSSILRSINSNAEITSRLRALAEVQKVVSSKLLEDGAVERLWLCIEDLISSTDSVHRCAAVQFMIAICQGQFNRMGLCRSIFFEHLKSIDDEYDGAELLLYTRLLSSLTCQAQDVNDFEEDIGAVSLAYLRKYLQRSTSAVEFLKLLQNFIKFNAAYFDEEVVQEIIKGVCILACRSTVDADSVVACLDVLDNVLCYSCWPKSSLLIVVTALCKLVNVESLCQHCWLFMRNLLGSHFGHGAVYTMCSLLQAADAYPDETVLRGAVFFIGASLWGAQRVESLRHSPGAVLGSMLCCLSGDSVMVAYEVALSLQRLIVKYGVDVQLLTWDLVLRCLERIFSIAEANNLPPSGNLLQVCHDTLDVIERLYDNNTFNGSPDQLFNVVERLAKQRPEASILGLLAYRTLSLSPSRGNWLSQLHALLDTYYNRDTRPTIRIKAVEIARNLFAEHHYLHGDDLIDVVMLPLFTNLHEESNWQVQANVINLIVDMAKLSGQSFFFELLGLIETLINNRLETMEFQTLNAKNLDCYFFNVELSLTGLIEILKAKWQTTPAGECLYIIKLICTHLLLQYGRQLFYQQGANARVTALEFLLSLRPETETGRLAYKEASEVVVSSYILSGEDDFSSSRLISCLAMCMEKERYWSVSKVLFTKLPGFLFSRRLALSDLESLRRLCVAAVNLDVNSDEESVLVDAERQMQTDAEERVYSLLNALIPYRAYFEKELQNKLATTIMAGVAGHKANYAVSATLSCLLEMPDVMDTKMRDLVARLRKLPSSPTIAIPLLELLSTLMRMQHLYKDFQKEDFEGVMYTLTSYMNPFMFTDFIVIMAYHISFRWFLQLPLHLRPGMAQYILRRISELMSRNASAKDPATEEALRQSHDEALQVCIGFLAHYAFTNQPPWYRRSPIAEQLFEKARTKHWVLGDRIVSLTCCTEATECQRCQRKRRTKLSVSSDQHTDDGTGQDFLTRRRRHASAIQKPVAKAPPSVPVSVDDSVLLKKSSAGSTPLEGESTLESNGVMDDLRANTAVCLCWCRDWVELTVEHAIGRHGWLMRVDDGQWSMMRRTLGDNADTLALLVAETENDEGSGFQSHSKRSSVDDQQFVSRIRIDDHQQAESINGSVLKIAVGENQIAEDQMSEIWELGAAASFGESAIDARSILLQLYSANIDQDQAGLLPLPDNQSIKRALTNLHRIYPYEAHKIGVIYVGNRQSSEAEILGNQFGSSRYQTFLNGLGGLIDLRQADPGRIYLGGLDTDGRDGEFTHHWSDASTQVVFHAATRMPNHEKDPTCRQKKLHIGNDFVSIVFNESGADYKLSTISGQFARVAIVVQPMDESILHIKLVAKDEISRWLAMKEVALSDEQAPLLCRQMAIRADVSARVWEQQINNQPLQSRIVERLRQIKHIKARFGGKTLTVERMFD